MMPNYPIIVACEYCDREMPSSQIARHEAVCIHNPDIAAAVRECLWECADGPFHQGQARYDLARRVGENIPSAHTVMAGLGTDWQGVGAWAGLRPQTERMGFSLEGMRELSRLNHDGHIGPGAREWDSDKPEGGYTAKYLLDVYKTWDKVLEAAGLVQGTRSYYIRKIQQRAKHGEEYAEAYIKEARSKAKTADADYPLLPGTWKQKTYALWPSGTRITSTVYELR